MFTKIDKIAPIPQSTNSRKNPLKNPKVLKMPMPEQARLLLASPAGPFTIHFWAPAFKWNLSIANLADYDRPVDMISTAQQFSLVSTGLIWTRWEKILTGSVGGQQHEDFPYDVSLKYQSSNSSPLLFIFLPGGPSSSFHKTTCWRRVTLLWRVLRCGIWAENSFTTPIRRRSKEE